MADVTITYTGPLDKNSIFTFFRSEIARLEAEMPVRIAELEEQVASLTNEKESLIAEKALLR